MNPFLFWPSSLLVVAQMWCTYIAPLHPAFDGWAEVYNRELARRGHT